MGEFIECPGPPNVTLDEENWHVTVDDGERVLFVPRDWVSIVLPAQTQGLTLWLGDGAPPILVDDRLNPDDLADFIRDPLPRRLWIERLRFWADTLENADTAS
jgi:hypothetical protein